MDNRITTIDELRAMTQGEIVELPPFIKDKKFYARLKRPSLLKLVESGRIPNRLLKAANTLFAGNVDNELENDDDFMKDLVQVIDVFAESVFVEPTWNDLKSAGIELTDEQYMFIFNYSQEGIRPLEPFREEQPNTGSNQHE